MPFSGSFSPVNIEIVLYISLNSKEKVLFFSTLIWSCLFFPISLSIFPSK